MLARHVKHLFQIRGFIVYFNVLKMLYIPATWKKFFKNAAIPTPTLQEHYANIFVKNRIELDMLNELNKEYLREVGSLFSEKKKNA